MRVERMSDVELRSVRAWVAPRVRADIDRELASREGERARAEARRRGVHEATVVGEWNS